jgi:hypothetical protein
MSIAIFDVLRADLERAIMELKRKLVASAAAEYGDIQCECCKEKAPDIDIRFLAICKTCATNLKEKA